MRPDFIEKYIDVGYPIVRKIMVRDHEEVISIAQLSINSRRLEITVIEAVIKKHNAVFNFNFIIKIRERGKLKHGYRTLS